MSTGKRRDAAKERYWRRMIRQCRESGLSVRAFCEQHGLAEASFYGWRRTLGQRAAEAVDFVPVRVVPEPTTVPDAHKSGHALELVLGSGRRVGIGPGFDAATLQRLLAVLEEGRPC
jgi:transposase-like protein